MSGKPARCDVSILTVGFNSRAFLADAFSSIAAASQRHSFEIRFVDNGQDGSEALVRGLFPAASIVPSRGNIGFAAANNYLAREAAGEWLLLLNPDTRLFPHAVDILLEAATASPSVWVLGGQAEDGHGVALDSSRLTFPTIPALLRDLLGKRPRQLPPVRSDLAPIMVDAVSGGFMLVRRSVWEAFGGMDERFFLYAEELDFCCRVHARGGLVALVPRSKLVHHVGSGDAFSPTRRLMLMRGMATYYRKHFGTTAAVCCLWLHWLGCLVRLIASQVVGCVSRQRRETFRSYRIVALRPWAWWQGYADGDGAS